MAQPPKELVIRLTQLLKENGEKILVDHQPLSLTLSFLRFLDDAFRSLTSDNDEFCASFEALPGNSPRVPYCHELQFLYDFIQKTPTLKLLCDTGNYGNDLVSLVMFRSLRQLELKRTSVHSLLGISRLRGKLHRVVCTRCLYSLQELLEDCGADQSSGLAWNQLTTLCLPYNNIGHLDSSLRLLPILQTLDLSHNQIRETYNHLEHLTELSEAHLGYNLLYAVPTFSVSSRSRLTSLGLQHNCLESVDGLCELQGLHQLDLSHNCLMSHSQLRALAGMARLRELSVVGNPLSLHVRHRTLTLDQIHLQAVKQLVLDKKPVTQQEATVSSRRLPSGVPSLSAQPPSFVVSPWTHQPSGINKPSGTNRPSGYVPYVSDDGASSDQIETTSSQTGNDITSSSAARRPTRRKTRARSAEISDIDDLTPGVSTSYQASNPRGPADVTPAVSTKVSNPRGQTDVEPAVSTSYKASTLIGPTVTEPGTSPEGATGEYDIAQYGTPFRDQEQMKDQIQKLRNHYGDSWLQIVSGKGNPRPEKPTPKNPTDADKTTTKAEIPAVIVESPPKEADVIINKENNLSSLNENNSSGDNDIEVIAYVEKNDLASTHMSLEDSKADSREHSSRSHGRRSVSTPEATDFVWSRNDSDVIDDHGPESEPFIVQIVTGDATPVTLSLLSVTERYLLEKDVEGTLLQKLDLKSLRSAQILLPPADTKHASGDQSSEVLQLLFDYYNKDRAERRYVMENQDDATALLDMVQPYIDFRLIGDALKERVKCLKCGTEFSRKDDISNSRFTKEKSASKDLPPCPSCQSDLVVEMDLGQVARSVGQVARSEGRDPSSMQHGPSSHSTPVKGQRNTRQLFGVTPPKHSSDSLPKSASSKSLQSTPSKTTKNIRKNISTNTPESLTNHQSENGIGFVRETSEDAGSTNRLSVSSDIDVIPREEDLQEITLSPIPDTREANLTVSPELTPCGSLSEKTISSMVSSMYEKSLPSPMTTSTTQDQQDSTVFHSDIDDLAFKSCVDSSAVDDPEEVDPGVIRFSYDDFSSVDHRLKLHLTMSVLSKDEDVKLLLKCDMVTSEEPQEFSGLFIITDNTVLVFKITAPPQSDDLSSWLTLAHSRPLVAVTHLEIGLHGQRFSLQMAPAVATSQREFVVCLVRDKGRCKRFMRPLTALLKQTACSDLSQLEGIQADRWTRDTLARELVTPEGGDVDTGVTLYVLCHQRIGALGHGSANLAPVSIIVTPSHIAMATENYHTGGRQDAQTDTRADAQTDDEGRQFDLKDIQLITNITAVETSRSRPCDLSLTFTEEDSNDEYTWRLIVSTTDTKAVLLGTVRQLWEELYGGVELNMAEGA